MLIAFVGKPHYNTSMNLDDYLTSFIAVFVAINALSVVPIYITLTQGMEDRRRVFARQSVITAFAVTLGFMLLGRLIFTAIGITVEDFMIAGGILLLIISVVNIIFSRREERSSGTTVAVVPLGTPLLAGPATLTTTLLLVGTHGYLPVIVALVATLLIAWFILSHAEAIVRVFGINGTLAFSKVASLLLAAIAVKMIRVGLLKIIALQG